MGRYFFICMSYTYVTVDTKLLQMALGYAFTHMNKFSPTNGAR